MIRPRFVGAPRMIRPRFAVARPAVPARSRRRAAGDDCHVVRSRRDIHIKPEIARRGHAARRADQCRGIDEPKPIVRAIKRRWTNDRAIAVGTAFKGKMHRRRAVGIKHAANCRHRKHRNARTSSAEKPFHRFIHHNSNVSLRNFSASPRLGGCIVGPTLNATAEPPSRGDKRRELNFATDSHRFAPIFNHE